MIDGRRIRKSDRDYFGFYTKIDDPGDIKILDQMVRDMRNPPNRLLIHELLTNYAKHNINGRIMA
jgi:hypothetical protein